MGLGICGDVAVREGREAKGEAVEGFGMVCGGFDMGLQMTDGWVSAVYTRYASMYKWSGYA